MNIIRKKKEYIIEFIKRLIDTSKLYEQNISGYFNNILIKANPESKIDELLCDYFKNLKNQDCLIA